MTGQMVDELSKEFEQLLTRGADPDDAETAADDEDTLIDDEDRLGDIELVHDRFRAQEQNLQESHGTTGSEGGSARFDALTPDGRAAELV